MPPSRTRRCRRRNGCRFPRTRRRWRPPPTPWPSRRGGAVRPSSSPRRRTLTRSSPTPTISGPSTTPSRRSTTRRLTGSSSPRSWAYTSRSERNTLGCMPGRKRAGSTSRTGETIASRTTRSIFWIHFSPEAPPRRNRRRSRSRASRRQRWEEGGFPLGICSSRPHSPTRCRPRAPPPPVRSSSNSTPPRIPWAPRPWRVSWDRRIPWRAWPLRPRRWDR
mmetsp:Transcript_37188/g.89737  ORF Transcript_37188/g.89737 Transcript_37188/m.89737 type:complete len:220 (-) Transcript_37188:306-965(-)